MSFPKYPAYKDSGVEWLGEVPAHWETASLGKISVLRCDGPFGSGITSDHYTEEGALVIRLQNIRAAGFYTGEPAFVSSEYFKNELTRHEVLPGDVLVAGLGDENNLVGRACVAPDNLGSALVKADCFRFRLNQEIAKPEFVAIQLSASAAYDAGTLATGSTRSRIPLSTMGSRKIALPPLTEQAAIATFLTRETSKIDALVAEQEKLITLLKEKRQAVISHAVTKGLDPSVPMKDSGVAWLGEVPAHWGVGGLTRFIGPVVDYRGRTPTKVDEGIYLVTARNIRNGKIDYEASEEYVDPESAASLLARGKPEVDDLLFTMEAPLGQVALIDRTDIALAQRIVKFRGTPGLMQNKFLLYWLMSEGCQARLETLATGSTALGIKASKLGMIECLAPPVDEQECIVFHIELETIKFDELIAEAQSAITLLQERRTALISAAVTGQIDVRGILAKEIAL